MVWVRRKSASPEIAVITPPIIKNVGGVPVGGRPPFEASCIKVGVDDGLNVGVWVIIGFNGIIVGVGNGV